jgi:hypothetical protein
MKTTSEIFELQQAYGETGYWQGHLDEFLTDILPHLDNDQLDQLDAAIRVIVLERSHKLYSESLPF